MRLILGWTTREEKKGGEDEGEQDMGCLLSSFVTFYMASKNCAVTSSSVLIHDTSLKSFAHTSSSVCRFRPNANELVIRGPRKRSPCPTVSHYVPLGQFCVSSFAQHDVSCASSALCGMVEVPSTYCPRRIRKYRGDNGLPQKYF